MDQYAALYSWVEEPSLFQIGYAHPQEKTIQEVLELDAKVYDEEEQGDFQSVWQ